MRRGRLLHIRNCKKCGRKLTDALRRSRGYGPVCFGKMPSLVMAELEAAGQLRFGSIP